MVNCKYKFVQIKKSTKKDKKLMAIFDDLKTVHFGAKGYTDFITNKDTKKNQIILNVINLMKIGINVIPPGHFLNIYYGVILLH